MYDDRRGLHSYGALKSRLARNRFSSEEMIDLNGPVINLKRLSYDELYLLLERLCYVHSTHYGYDVKLGQEELTEFLQMAVDRMGADKLVTTREITKDFLGLLDILYQNPGKTFRELMDNQGIQIQSAEKDPEKLEDSDEDVYNQVDSIFADFDI